MEINSLGESRVGKSGADQTGSLLRQLKASGSIEAVVLRLLPGKLLLGSRVGEILTSNTLNLQPGDRIRIRLDDSAAQPVLKMSREQDPPVILQASANTRLKQALPDQQFRLALVLKVARQATEIQLADERFNLPRRLAVVSRDLLSLQRDDSRDRIEIRVLDKKPIYKALLQQLLPRQPQTGTRESSLVRLVNLIRGVIVDKSPNVNANANPRIEPAGTKGNPQRNPAVVPPAKRIAPAPTSAAGQLPALAAISPWRSAAPDPAGKPAQSPNAAAGRPASGAKTKSNLSLRLPVVTATKPTIRSAAGQDSVSTRQDAVPASPLTPGSAKNPPQTGPVWQRLLPSSASRPAFPSPSPPALPVRTNPPQAERGAPSRQPVQNRSVLPSAQTTAPQAGSATDPDAASLSGKTASTPGQTVRITPTPTAASAPKSWSTSSLPGFAPPGDAVTKPGTTQGSILLQLVQRLPDFAAIDRADIHRWLEISGLAPAKPQQSTSSAATDLARLLARLVDGEAFDRELNQLLQAQTRSAGSEDRPTRHQPVENWLASVRDGLRMVEQSLASNLLQRASIGLQQETQQPASLSFALPVIDQQEVKPLWIDLQQRGGAASDEGQGWDLRIEFEFGDLGPISCHIFLQGFRIAASFYSEWASTQESIDRELPRLRQQLVAAGFDPGEIHSFPAAMAPLIAAGSEFTESLIDVEV